MEVFELRDVFTPSQPAAEINYIQRPAISKRFDRALDQKGKQIIIYGPSGAGKTSLLRNKIEESNLDVLTTHCLSSMTFEDILNNAFNELDVYIEQEKSTSHEIETKAEGGINLAFIPIKAGVSGSDSTQKNTKYKKAIDFKPTAQGLIEILGSQNKIWIIEDFHKIHEDEKRHFSQVMKLFMDKSIKYPNLKIIAIGAVNTARQVIQYDAEMKSRISEIEVSLMNSEELSSIILRGENLLNVNIASSVKDRITKLSSGLPSVTHQLCYLLCKEERINKTNNNIKKIQIFLPTLDKAIEEYISDYSDTFRSTLEQAVKVNRTRKHDNPGEILKAILALKKECFNVNDVLKKLQVFHKEYRGTSLEKHMLEFTTPERGEILRFLDESEEFYFSNPFIKAFFLCTFNGDSGFIKLNAKIKLNEVKNNLDYLYEGINDDFEDDYFDTSNY